VVPPPEVTHVLLDFFGTLVGVSANPEQGYHASHALVRSLGAQADYRDFLQTWAGESARFDQRSAADDSEYSMDEVAAAVLSRLLRRDPSGDEAAALAGSFIREWNRGVSYPPGTREVVAALAGRFRLAVVSNTNQAGLVPGHLAAMGVDRYLDAVITSVELGWRKPHPAIYAAALDRLGISAASAVFAGDTYETDYAGPVEAGMTAFLIDPERRHDIPAGRRLDSLADLPGRLGVGPEQADQGVSDRAGRPRRARATGR
jgi:putative hydrolase of the HAD superfamily